MHAWRAASGLMALALAAGCATGTPGGGPSSTVAPSPTVSSPPGGCPTSVKIAETDASAMFCVARTGTVTLTLHGPGWTPLVISNDALVIGAQTTPADGRVVTLRAAHPGSATLKSSRSACPSPSPGGAACHALQAFTVTVTVR